MDCQWQHLLLDINDSRGFLRYTGNLFLLKSRQNTERILIYGGSFKSRLIEIETSKDFVKSVKLTEACDDLKTDGNSIFSNMTFKLTSLPGVLN